MYDDAERRTEGTYQLGETKKLYYNPAGRLTAVELPEVISPATVAPACPRYEHGYDAQGNQTLIRDPLDRVTP